MKIGEILMEMGCLTEKQLRNALQKQEEVDMRGERHVPIGKILVESGFITLEDLLLALAQQ
jgi:hypothetical protein